MKETLTCGETGKTPDSTHSVWFSSRSVVGCYLVLYCLLWLFQRHTPKSGGIYLSALFLVTFCLGWIWFFQRSARWKWCRITFVRLLVTTVLALLTAYLICIATLFDPLGARPSPLSLSDEHLDILLYVSRVLIGLCGVWLIVRASRHAA